MRGVLALACVVFVLAVTGEAEAQVRRKPPGKRSALAFDAKLVNLEESRGLPSKLFYETSDADSKKLGFKEGSHPVNARTKFVLVGASGEKSFAQKTVLADEEAKKYLKPESKVRVQVSGVEVEVGLPHGWWTPS